MAFYNFVSTKALNSTTDPLAPKDSPALTGTPTAPTAASGTNNTQIATTAFVKTAIDASKSTTLSGYGITDANINNGTITLGSNTLTPVQGPSSSVNNRVAVFDGTSGKTIKDSGFTIGKSVPSDAVFTDTVYTHPSGFTTKTTSSVYKFTVDGNGHVTAGDAVTSMPASDVYNWAKASAKPTYTASEVGAAASDHTHSLSIASDTGTSSISLSANTKYKLTAGGSTYVFTTPSDTNTVNTAGSTDKTGTKLYLIGAETQAASPQTYSYSKLYLDTNGMLRCENGVKDAVWNDLTDLISVDEECDLEYGRVYCFDGEHYTKSNKYLAEGIIGIHSDTSGFQMGHKEGTKELQCSVAGFVLAYVDKEYPVGTPLTAGENGCLTEILMEDKIRYPERIVATYWKKEDSDEWGSDSRKVKVNGRKWVKIK